MAAVMRALSAEKVSDAAIIERSGREAECFAAAGIYPESVTAQRTGLEGLYLNITGSDSGRTTDHGTDAETKDGRNALAPR
ncbi:MAG: hypothetical protein JWN52_4292 [Actinomycetia bacterium]|nr:hypothetical protein [Actinomycetes bacterium]